MATNWLNPDGLYQKFGTNEGTETKAGQFPYTSGGANQVVEADILLTDLALTPTVLSDGIRVPMGARIEKVEIIVVTAATGAGAVLNVGLIKDDRTTELDYDGFVAALAVTSLTPAGFTVILYEATTGNGALIGTSISLAQGPGLLTADYDTAAFTAGRIKVRIFFNNMVPV